MNASREPSLNHSPSASPEFASASAGDKSAASNSGQTGHQQSQKENTSAAHIRLEILEMAESLSDSLGGLREDISKSILQALVQRSYKLLRYVIALNGLDPSDEHKQAERLAENGASMMIELAPSPEVYKAFDKALANYRRIIEILNAEVKNQP